MVYHNEQVFPLKNALEILLTLINKLELTRNQPQDVPELNKVENIQMSIVEVKKEEHDVRGGPFRQHNGSRQSACEPGLYSKST